MLLYNADMRFLWKPVDIDERAWHQLNDDFYIIKFPMSLPLNMSITEKEKRMWQSLQHFFPYLNDLKFVKVEGNSFGEVFEDPFDSPNISQSNVILHYNRDDIDRVIDEKPHLFV